jgi:hypothetical protein
MSSLTQLPRLFFPPIRFVPPQPAGVVYGGAHTRPLWFDGRFLAAHDLSREQHFFLQRQAELGRAGGFGVVHGLLVDQGATITHPPSAQTIVVHAGVGITPAGSLVMISSDLTIQLSDLPDEENLDVQFGLSTAPQQPARTRTGLYVIALRAVQFTANPITFYPATLQSPRIARDGDIVEATAVSLIPYTNPVNNYDASLQQAALARQIFVEGDAGTLDNSVLPLAMVSIDRDVIQWIDPYLVRRDSGPEYSRVRLGLTDPATQQAFLLQYDAQLQAIVGARQSNGQKAHFAASDYLQALPPAGRFPLDAIDTGAFTQIFFPQQMNVELSIVPADELPAIIEDGMFLPPIDLTLSATTYANMSVYALVPVPRNSFAGLQSSLQPVPLTAALPQIPVFRPPFPLLQFFQGRITTAAAIPASSSGWSAAIGSQQYGFYVLRRSEPIFVDFTTPPSAPAAVQAAQKAIAAQPAAQAALPASVPAAALSAARTPIATPAPTTTPAPRRTDAPTTTPAPKAAAPKVPAAARLAPAATTTPVAAPSTTPHPTKRKRPTGPSRQ